MVVQGRRQIQEVRINAKYKSGSGEKDKEEETSEKEYRKRLL